MPTGRSIKCDNYRVDPLDTTFMLHANLKSEKKLVLEMGQTSQKLVTSAANVLVLSVIHVSGDFINIEGRPAGKDILSAF